MLRVLLLADTHLGFDLPLAPRVERVRRGPDFFANTWRALAPALAGEVDLVVHGGDLLYRSRVPAALVRLALEPLLAVADRGVPVVLVPGNHERSALPFPLLAAHRHLHLLERPRTVFLDLAGLRVAVAGFPCERERVRERFAGLVAATGALAAAADVRLLCLHQTVEGARVGPSGYCFRGGDDVVRGRDLPAGFAAVLAGHIHRHQVLTADLAGRPLAAPVFYPGSVERTSGAERDEVKGFLLLELDGDARVGGCLAGWQFRPLPSRPLVTVVFNPAGRSADELERELAERLAALPADAAVRVAVVGDGSVPSAATLRRCAGSNQVVEWHVPAGGRR